VPAFIYPIRDAGYVFSDFVRLLVSNLLWTSGRGAGGGGPPPRSPSQIAVSMCHYSLGVCLEVSFSSFTPFFVGGTAVSNVYSSNKEATFSAWFVRFAYVMVTCDFGQIFLCDWGRRIILSFSHKGIFSLPGKVFRILLQMLKRLFIFLDKGYAALWGAPLPIIV